MPALAPTDFTARVTWLGVNPDREAGLPSNPVERVELGFDGIRGDTHGGLTRPSCSRVSQQYKRGTEIKNSRQLSVLSAEELAQIAANMGVEALDPALLGASLVIEGIPDFSLVPPASRLVAEGGASIVVDMENRPCHLPAKPIDAAGAGEGRRFKAAAVGLRGVTAYVEREGSLVLGEALRLHIPDQPAWPHMGAARGA